MEYQSERRGDYSTTLEKVINIEKNVDKILIILEGNGKPGLVLENDRNTQYRKGLIKALWFLLTPLYASIIAIFIKLILR